MKRSILGWVVCCAVSFSACGQGEISFDNSSNQGDSTAVSGGRFWDWINNAPALLTVPTLHGKLLGGASPNSLSVLNRFLGGNSASVLLDFLAPGQYTDETGNPYIVPGVPSGGKAYFEVIIWEGDASSVSEALANGYHTAGSVVFSQTVGGGLAVPASLTGMPSIGFVPEPGVAPLAAFGALTLRFFRRRGFPE